jgi:hypothetical protein
MALIEKRGYACILSRGNCSPTDGESIPQNKHNGIQKRKHDYLKAVFVLAVVNLTVSENVE